MYVETRVSNLVPLVTSYVDQPSGASTVGGQERRSGTALVEAALYPPVNQAAIVEHQVRLTAVQHPADPLRFFSSASRKR